MVKACYIVTFYSFKEQGRICHADGQVDRHTNTHQHIQAHKHTTTHIISVHTQDTDTDTHTGHANSITHVTKL